MTFADHEGYLASCPEAFQPMLRHVRTVLADALPHADEMIAYNLPGFRMNGTVVASYAAFAKQCGVYFLGAALTEHADEISAAGLKATKTGITFTPRTPPSDELLVRLARSSATHSQP